MFPNNVYQHGLQAYHSARMLRDYPAHLVIYAVALKLLEKGLAMNYAQASMMASAWVMIHQSTQDGERIFQETRHWLDRNASTPEQQAALERDQVRMQSFNFPPPPGPQASPWSQPGLPAQQQIAQQEQGDGFSYSPYSEQNDSNRLQ